MLRAYVLSAEPLQELSKEGCIIIYFVLVRKLVRYFKRHSKNIHTYNTDNIYMHTLHIHIHRHIMPCTHTGTYTSHHALTYTPNTHRHTIM